MNSKWNSKSVAARWKWLLCASLLWVARGYAAGPWDQPAARLADQIAAILGPGQAQLVVANRSTIQSSELAPIRRLMEQDLRAHGVQASGAESANVIRVTLSEDARERLWVAEIIEGSQTQVTMVELERGAAVATVVETTMLLQKKRIWSSSETAGHGDEPVLAALEMSPGLILLEQHGIVIYSKASGDWQEQKRFSIDSRRPMARDPRGLLIVSAGGNGFSAYLPGTECAGSYPAQSASTSNEGWTVNCHASDDPWPIGYGSAMAPYSNSKAFYNSARNYFTGVITPATEAGSDSQSGIGPDRTPFYSAAVLPMPAVGGTQSAALLLNAVDGKVHLEDNGASRPVSGTRDWGSDFAALHSGCGMGTQIVVSSSGEAANDSLRAYDVRRQEAIAVSSPMEIEGTVTALATAPDGASVVAIIRTPANSYEVDRVTAICP